MERNHILLLAAGIIITALLYILMPGQPYFAYMAAIVVIVLFMGVLMMNTSKRFADLPALAVRLCDDGKGVIVMNTGKEDALSVHVALVPLNIEFDLESLAAGSAYTFRTEEMINEAKAYVTFKTPGGSNLDLTKMLNALQPDADEDILKPVFPLFKWK
jgi:hypothetical protein